MTPVEISATFTPHLESAIYLEYPRLAATKAVGLLSRRGNGTKPILETPCLFDLRQSQGSVYGESGRWGLQ